MVRALIEISGNVNRVLNIIKAKFDLKDKGAAVEFIVNDYVEYKNEPELRQEFIKKIKEIEKHKSIKVDNFAERYGLEF